MHYKNGREAKNGDTVVHLGGKAVAMLIACLILLFGSNVKAQYYGMPTWLNGTGIGTNTGNIVVYQGGFYIPAASLTINGTNPLAFDTNTYNYSINIGQTNYAQLTNNFVFNASVWGTNFSSNFPAIWMPITVYGFQRMSPGPNGTNTYIQ